MSISSHNQWIQAYKYLTATAPEGNNVAERNQVRYKAVIKVSAGMKSRLHIRLGKDLLGALSVVVGRIQFFVAC